MTDMQQYFKEVASIPVYINMMETVPKNAVQAKLPISDDMLVAIATKAILASDSFPRATDSREDKTDKDKTWAKWKDTYLTTNKSCENFLRAAGDTGGQNFGTENATSTTTNDQQVTIQDPHTIPRDNFEHLDSYLNKISDNVANAATTGSLDAADIYSMAKSLETLTLANTTLVREVASLRAYLANSSS